MTAILRAVRRSALTANQRLVAMTIASLSDPKTGIIPERYRPTSQDLAPLTGLSRTATNEAVWAISAAGWIERARRGKAVLIVAALIPGAMVGAETDTDVEPSDDAATRHPTPSDDAATRHRPDSTMPPHGTSDAATRHPTDQNPNDTVLLENLYGPTGQTHSALFDLPAAAAAPTPATKTDEPPGFPEFWAEYPRKVGKGHARKAWTKAVDAGTTAATLIAAAAAYAAQCARIRKEQQYIPHPATWLNGERWTDAPETAPSTNGRLVEYNGHMLKPETVENLKRRDRFAAMGVDPPQAIEKGA